MTCTKKTITSVFICLFLIVSLTVSSPVAARQCSKTIPAIIFSLGIAGIILSQFYDPIDQSIKHFPKNRSTCCQPEEFYDDNHMFFRQTKNVNANNTLLYMHGLGESGACFENLYTHAGLNGWNHLVPDLPGYGQSNWLLYPLPLERQADYMADLVNQREFN